MANFAYKGRDGGGNLIEGVLEGATSGNVADILLGRGITPVSIQETRAKAKSAGDGGFDLFKPKVEHVDILLFSRQIHTLLKSGVPIMRALSGLQESATNPAMKDVIRDVRESLEAGRELSVSLARHPEVFNPFYISMVRVGEATGLLDEIFLRLFDHLEFERFMREQVKSALRYPMFVVMAMAAALIGSSIAMVAGGPSPGRMPTTVPSSTPAKHQNKLSGSSATAKPCIIPEMMSTPRNPASRPVPRSSRASARNCR